MKETLLPVLQQSLWSQLGASLDMLENAIAHCPEEHWNSKTKFWYNAYHCLFFTDYDMSLQPADFAPPAPYTLSEFTYDEMPPRVYTKEELLSYLQYSREKGHRMVAGLTEAQLSGPWTNGPKTTKYVSLIEFIVHTMRHIQHHTAQLNLLLRQSIDDAPKWVRHSKLPL